MTFTPSTPFNSSVKIIIKLNRREVLDVNSFSQSLLCFAIDNNSKVLTVRVMEISQNINYPYLFG